MLLTARVDHYAVPSLGLEQVKVWLKNCYVSGRGVVPEMSWETYFPLNGDMSYVLCPLWAQVVLELGLNQDGDPYIGYDEFCDAVYETLREGSKGMSYEPDAKWHDFEKESSCS